MEKIIDEFTNLNVSRQRKWQFRHPNLARIIRKRYAATLKGLVWHRENMRKRTGAVKRSFNTRSYRMERKAKEAND